MSAFIDDNDFPTYELGIFVDESRADDEDGMTKRQTGDIVVSRPASNGIGLKERFSLIWLRVEGWSKSRFDALDSSVFAHSQVDPVNDKSAVEPEDEEDFIEKFRFCIPLKALKKIRPDFDVDRASDELDPYQPFMIVDEGNGDEERLDEGLFLVGNRPVDPDGLIFDKVLNRYIWG